MSQAIPLARLSSASSAPYASVSTSPGTGNESPSMFAYDSPEDASQIHPKWKRNLYKLMEQPTSSRNAFLIHFFTTFLIVVSAIVTVLETIPEFHSISTSFWFGLETALVVLFTVEYSARCVAHSSSWPRFFKWFGSWFGIIDLLGILPYYIEIALQQDTSILFRFTILRVFRLLRVFRPFRHNNTILLTIEVMYLSFRRSQHALFALGFFVGMVLTVFSTLLYFVERGTWDETLGTFLNSDGDPSQFASIPAAGWFVLVTITTVGYGEITPRSFLGRIITLPLLVFGLLLIALPTFVLGREFSIVWQHMEASQRAQQDASEEGDVEALHSDLPPLERNVRDIATTSAFFGMGDETLPRPRRSISHQSELNKELADLRAKVDMQGEMLRRIMEAVEGPGKAKAEGASRRGSR